MFSLLPGVFAALIKFSAFPVHSDSFYFSCLFQVQLANDKSKTYALKCLKKKHIVETRQQEHVFSEKRIMMEANTPFIAK